MHNRRSLTFPFRVFFTNVFAVDSKPSCCFWTRWSGGCITSVCYFFSPSLLDLNSFAQTNSITTKKVLRCLCFVFFVCFAAWLFEVVLLWVCCVSRCALSGTVCVICVLFVVVFFLTVLFVLLFPLLFNERRYRTQKEMLGGDEVSAIVIDVGHTNTRAGYAGVDTPGAVFPSVLHQPLTNAQHNTTHDIIPRYTSTPSSSTF